MSTARAKLQELKLPQLREMASSVDVDHDGLQKSKLIAAILDSEKFDASMLPEDAPEDVAAVASKDAEGEGDTASSDDGGDDRQGQGQGQGRNRNRNRRNRNRNRNREPIDESELEVRQGTLDILPEGYGFLRMTLAAT